MNWFSGPHYRDGDRMGKIEKLLFIALIIGIGFLLGLICKYQFSDPVYYDQPEGILSRM